MAVAASYDQTGRYGAQTPFSDQLAFHWEAGNWQVDSSHDSLVTIGNGGDKQVRAELTILYNHGSPAVSDRANACARRAGSPAS